MQGDFNLDAALAALRNGEILTGKDGFFQLMELVIQLVSSDGKRIRDCSL